MKKTSAEEQGATYDPPDGLKGTSTTNTIVGKVVIDFDLDSDSGDITYTIIEKPILAPEHEVWKGIETAINRCR